MGNLISIDEKHYTVTELGKAWQMDPKTIRRLFINEPGVIVLPQRKGIRGRRVYTSLRIPASVAERVHRRLQRKGAQTEKRLSPTEEKSVFRTA